MRFGVREICNVVFKAKNTVSIGSRVFLKGQPVLYIDTAKTSTVEGAATTVYATGGPGNTRLIAWEGERHALDKRSIYSPSESLIGSLEIPFELLES